MAQAERSILISRSSKVARLPSLRNIKKVFFPCARKIRKNLDTYSKSGYIISFMTMTSFCFCLESSCIWTDLLLSFIRSEHSLIDLENGSQTCLFGFAIKGKNMNRKIYLLIFIFTFSFAWTSSFAQESGKTASEPKKAKPKKRRRRKRRRSRKKKVVKRKVEKKKKKKPRVPTTKAEKIVEEMIKVTGGRKALSELKSIYAKGSSKVVTPLGMRTARLVQYTLKPKYQRVEQHFGRQVMVITFYPGGGWLSQNGVTIQLPRSMLEVSRSENARMDLELRYLKENIKVVLKGTKKVKGMDCWEIQFIDRQKRKTTYFIDKDKKLLRKRTYMGPSPLGQGKVRFSTFHSNFKWLTIHDSKNKIQLPFQIEQHMRGNKVGTMIYQQIKLNSPKVTKGRFKRSTPVE